MSSEFNFYDANLDNLEKYSDCDDEDWNQLPPNAPKSNKIAIDSFNGNHFRPSPVTPNTLINEDKIKQKPTQQQQQQQQQQIQKVKNPPTTKDYFHLAQTYKMHSSYQVSQLSSSGKGPPNCILCQKNKCDRVFFPCEHVCVCEECIITNQFIESEKMKYQPGGYNICPLCAMEIKKMFRFDNGRETERYWAWVHEIVPQLPTNFMKTFRHSGAIIKKIYIDEYHEKNRKDNRLKKKKKPGSNNGDERKIEIVNIKQCSCVIS